MASSCNGSHSDFLSPLLIDPFLRIDMKSLGLNLEHKTALFNLHHLVLFSFNHEVSFLDTLIPFQVPSITDCHHTEFVVCPFPCPKARRDRRRYHMPTGNHHRSTLASKPDACETVTLASYHQQYASAKPPDREPRRGDVRGVRSAEMCRSEMRS